MDPVKFRLGTAPEGEARELPTGGQLCMVLIGEFRGSASEEAQSRPLCAVPIDRDNFDSVLADLSPACLWQRPDGVGERLEFRALDDFHPDQLLQHSQFFPALRAAATRLASPSTPPQATPAAPNMATDQLLDQILVEQDRATAVSTGPSEQDRWARVIQEIVGPAVAAIRAAPTPDRRAADELVAMGLRELLHDPKLQKLEALWNGLWWLLRRSDEESCRLFVLDCPRSRLAEELGQTELHRIVRAAVGSNPGILLCLHNFSACDEDVSTLERLAVFAEQSRLPCIAAATSSLFGCDVDRHRDADDWQSLDSRAQQQWNELRKIPATAWLALLWPRFLLRVPYGPQSSPVESFPFEERDDAWQHEHYLWGHPALALADLIARAYERSGVQMQLGDATEITGLPLVVQDVDGEPTAHPVGELLLGQREARAVAAQGIIPLLSVRGTDAIRLASFHSLNLDRTPLLGPWSA